MKVRNNSQVNLEDLIHRVKIEGSSTGITGKTFCDLVAYAKNSTENFQGLTFESNDLLLEQTTFVVDRKTGQGVYAVLGSLNGIMVSNYGNFIKRTFKSRTFKNNPCSTL